MKPYPLKFTLCQIYEDRTENLTTVWRSPVTFDARDERYVRQAVMGACSADGVTRWAEADDGEILFGLLGKPVRGSLLEVPIERLEKVRTEYGAKS